MLTINVKTKAVTGKDCHPPVMVNTPWGVMDQTPGYVRGWLPPRFPVPALAMNVEWDTWNREVVLWNECAQSGDGPRREFECLAVWAVG